ncbi:MAG: GxxExxY protein [Planctomycetes bacterium]|nr:GxxExxY protein [Planctomycetota bacterium]NUQ35120.1 GxxExxY protein [Planctomycetaceae bacterium]
MNADKEAYFNNLTEQVIGAAMEVSNHLGTGFLEKVYENALAEELRLRHVPAQTQVPIKVNYKGKTVGDYVADILVDGRLIVELKCVRSLAPEHIGQCLNYLKGTGHSLALLFNFQNPKLEWKRVVFNF